MVDPNCRKDYKLRYLWHLSCSPRLGADVVTMVPSHRGINRGDNEPHNTRFCCSIYPTGGFVALPLREKRKYYLYRSVSKITSYRPYDVGDSSGTGERWLFDDYDFKKMLEIPSKDFRLYRDTIDTFDLDLGSCFSENIKRQRRALVAIHNLLKKEFVI